jgi:hypothetical protein
MICTYEKDERLAAGLSMGERNLRGVSVIPSANDILVLIHCLFDDKDVAKGFGARYDRRNGWHLRAADLAGACQLLKDILGHDLAEKLANKGKIALNVHYNFKDFDRCWAASVAGVLPAVSSASPWLPETTTKSDIRLSGGETAGVISGDGFIGVAMSEKGPIGFAINTGGYYPGTNASIKKLAGYAGGRAKWLADKKLWLIPLECAALIGSGTSYERVTAEEVFDHLPWTEEAAKLIEARRLDNV